MADTSDRDVRIASLLEEALVEFRARGAIDLPAWKGRFPELADDLPSLLDTVCDMETAAGDWKRPEERTLADVPPGIEEEKKAFEFLAPPQQSDEIGRLDGYRILNVLGAGGMGMVFQAEDLHLHRKVALKTLKPELAQRPEARERFLREARAAAALEHDHVIPIYGVGEADGVPYLAMPLLKGQPLDEHLKQGQKLPIPTCVRIARQMAAGLAAAHQHGLIHRDIKPSNIWIEPDHGGRVKILDFGLAKTAEAGDALTQSGSILGTPAYMHRSRRAPTRLMVAPICSASAASSTSCSPANARSTAATRSRS